jgi:hypothetical protein
LQELERNFPGLEAIDILNAIKHPPRARKAEPEKNEWSENFFKVHMFGRIIDDLMLGIPSLSLAREHKCIGVQSLRSKNKILDFVAVSRNKPLGFETRVSMINCEEKKVLQGAESIHNLQIRQVNLNDYYNNSADRIKLGRSMRDDLAYRRPINDTMTQFGKFFRHGGIGRA